MSEEKVELVNVVVARPNEEIVVEGQQIVLDLIDGWEKLEDRQQKYLEFYAKDPTGNKNLVAMSLGYKISEIDKWFSQETFSLVSQTIYDIYTDVLKGIDFSEAIHSQKIRGRVIESRENGGKYTKDKKGTTHQHLHLNNFSLKDLNVLSDN